jgi:hypothetical protein
VGLAVLMTAMAGYDEYINHSESLCARKCTVDDKIFQLRAGTFEKGFILTVLQKFHYEQFTNEYL